MDTEIAGLCSRNKFGKNKYGLLTKREVKMAGIGQVCLFLPWLGKDFSSCKLRTKKLFEPASVKSFLVGTQRAIPSGQHGSNLTARVANQSTGFASSCSLIEPAI